MNQRSKSSKNYSQSQLQAPYMEIKFQEENPNTIYKNKK
jgi:hypothetical protein